MTIRFVQLVPVGTEGTPSGFYGLARDGRVWFGRVHSTSAESGPHSIDWYRLEEHEKVPPA